VRPMKEVEKVCGNCARWKVPNSGCTYMKDIQDGTIRASDQGCDDFYPNPKGKGKREALPLHKASGVSDLGPFEAIYHDGTPAFLVKTQDGFSILESVTNQGHKVVPKEIGEFPYQPYGYYEHAIPSRETLFWRIRDEFDLFLDTEPVYKDFLAACVLLSHQQEKAKTVPYVYFYGDNESGKTVALTLLSLLCYRPLFGVTIPAADIYGYLDDSDSPGTILEDEIQGVDRDWDKAKIYKAGYKEGATIPRTFMLEHKRFIKYFRCFCFKAAAAEDMPRVKGLLERFIFIPMVEGYPKKDWADVNGDDVKRLHELRNMLLKWRLISLLDWSLPEAELSVKGRLKELWKPIIQIVSGLTTEPSLRQFLGRLQAERMNEKTNTLEGHLVKVISELYVKNKPIPFTDIWDALVIDLEGNLDGKKPNKMDTPEFGDITKQKVGYRLREVLAGNKTAKRIEEKLGWCYTFDDDKIRRIAKKYGFNIVSKLASLASSEGATTSETMEKDHQNNVEKALNTPLEVTKLSNSLTDTKSIDITKVKAVVSLEPADQGVCVLCGERRTLTWQIQYFNGEWADVCQDCGASMLEKVKG